MGGFFSLSATLLPFLEGFAMLRTYANSTSEGSPQLLQVLGDTTIGVKGDLPEGLLGPLQLGAEMLLLLLNGTGDVGVSGGSTSARFKLNTTLDLRQLQSVYARLSEIVALCERRKVTVKVKGIALTPRFAWSWLSGKRPLGDRM